jgi:hypothetical protein
MVLKQCPAACDWCGDKCEDYKNFKFKVWDDSMQGCDWITKHTDQEKVNNRLEKWCDTDQDVPTYSYCAKTCNYQQCADASEQPSSTPSSFPSLSPSVQPSIVPSSSPSKSKGKGKKMGKGKGKKKCKKSKGKGSKANRNIRLLNNSKGKGSKKNEEECEEENKFKNQCEKPSDANKKTVKWTVKADGDIDKDELNSLLCKEKSDDRFRRLSDSKDKKVEVLSVQVTSLEKEKEGTLKLMQMFTL